MNSSLASLRRLLFVLFGLGVLTMGCLMFVPNSATAIWQIRWYPLYVTSMVFMCVGSCALFISGGRSPLPAPRLIFLFLLVGVGLIAGAVSGPFTGRSLIYSLSTCAVIFLATVFLVNLRKEDLHRIVTSGTFQMICALFLMVWCGYSLYAYLTGQIFPLLEKARLLDEAAKGGLYDLIIDKHYEELRNGLPFGHPNYVSGFLLISLPLLYFGMFTPATRKIQWMSWGCCCLGLVVLMTTQSRNALLGLILAIGVSVWWNQLERKRTMQILAGLGILALLLIVLIPRFQRILMSVSPERQGLWKTAWNTGVRYFPFGSGEGLTTEMIQYFSPQLDAIWGNSLQFHHTWLHLWAVGGVLAGVGILGVTGWVLWKVLFPGEMDPKFRKACTPSVMALSASFVVFWADYQMDILPIALLLFLHLVVFAVWLRPEKKSETPVRIPGFIPTGIAGVCLLVCMAMVPASLRSRRAIDEAGKAYELGETASAVDHYLQAYEEVKEPYALNMAAVLLSFRPAGHQQSKELFYQSLDLWEAQVLVHEYLYSLWMKTGVAAEDENASAEAFERAYAHAVRRIEIAPHLAGNYLDLARVLHRLSRPDEEIVNALLFELVMQGNLVFPNAWGILGELETYRPLVIEKLLSLGPVENKAYQSRIDMMQAVLHLMGGIPEGREVDERIREKTESLMQNAGVYQLLSDLCTAEDHEKEEPLNRLLVYVLESPVSHEAVHTLMEQMSESCTSGILTFGNPRLRQIRFQGVGLSARHPFSIPVMRPFVSANTFGLLFIPQLGHKTFRPEIR